MRLTALAAIAVLAQVPASCQSTENASFEVASVKRSNLSPPDVVGPARGGPGTTDPEQIRWSYATLKGIIMVAYDVKPFQVSGPNWINTERYDIAAKIAPGTSKDEVRVMWRNLLAERFGVRLHRESKELRVEELVIAKGGPKFKESEDDPTRVLASPPKFDGNGQLVGLGLVNMLSFGPNGPTTHSVARALPISKLAELLSSQLHVPVLDKTGLTGYYDFELDYVPDRGGAPIPGPPGSGSVSPAETSLPEPNLASAVQEQLGLRLKPGNAKLDLLVIDKAEKIPTGN